MFRIVATDLDGTLLRSDSSISDRTRRVLAQCREKGMELIVVTARPPRATGIVLGDDLSGGTWVCHNGGTVVREGEIVARHHMSREEAVRLAELVREWRPDGWFGVEIDDMLYATGPHPVHGDWEHVTVDLPGYITAPVAKMLVDVPRGADPRPLLERIPATCRAMRTDGGSLIQINAADSTKIDTLHQVVAEMGMTMADVIAFGDDVSDEEMIREAGMGVAMGNAPAQVQRAADCVAPTCDEDGVATILEAMFPFVDEERVS